MYITIIGSCVQQCGEEVFPQENFPVPEVIQIIGDNQKTEDDSHTCFVFIGDKERVMFDLAGKGYFCEDRKIPFERCFWLVMVASIRCSLLFNAHVLPMKHHMHDYTETISVHLKPSYAQLHKRLLPTTRCLSRIKSLEGFGWWNKYLLRALSLTTTLCKTVKFRAEQDRRGSHKVWRSVTE